MEDPKIEPLLRQIFPPETTWGITNTTPNQAELTEKEAIYLKSVSAISRRNEFISGRTAAHIALKKIGVKEEVLRSGDGMPIWPDNIAGSICHKNGYAIAVATFKKDYIGIGIDLEPLLPNLDISKKIASLTELAWIHQKDSLRRLTTLYSAKESLFKCVYPITQTFFGFKDAELTPTEYGFEAHIMKEFSDIQLPNKIIIKSVILDDLTISGTVLKA